MAIISEYWRCGSIYGHKGANEQLVVKKPGEWNMIVTAKGQQIDIELNGKHIVSANLAGLDFWNKSRWNRDSGMATNPVCEYANKRLYWFARETWRI